MSSRMVEGDGESRNKETIHFDDVNRVSRLRNFVCFCYIMGVTVDLENELLFGR